MNQLPYMLGGFAIGSCISFTCIMGMRAILAFADMEGSGIYLSPDHTSVYIQGQHCTIDYSADPVEFYNRIDWCQTQYIIHQPNNLPL